MPKFDKTSLNLYTYKERSLYRPTPQPMNHVESPIKNIIDNLKDNELGAAILDETIGDTETLLTQMKELEEDTHISGFKKARKKLWIDIKGRFLFGDEWKNAVAQENKDKEKKHKPNKKKSTEQDTQTPEITSDKYDKANMKIIQDALTRYGITNPHIQRAILATIAKESGFKPQIPEKSYKDTDNKRIREIFGRRVSGLSERDLDKLKANEQAFRDRVYGPDDPTEQAKKLGNTEPGDGMKYRGRGFNGITFKSTYKKYGDMIGVDLVKNPELLENPDIAAKVNAAYFAEGLKNSAIIQKYGNKAGPNDFNNFTTALQAAININAGIRKNINSRDLQENYNKALAAAAHIDVTTIA